MIGDALDNVAQIRFRSSSGNFIVVNAGALRYPVEISTVAGTAFSTSLPAVAFEARESFVNVSCEMSGE